VLCGRLSSSPLPPVSKSGHGIINHFTSVSGLLLSRKAGLRRTKPSQDSSASQQQASARPPRLTGATAARPLQLWRPALCTAPKTGQSLMPGESWKRSWKESQRGEYMAHVPFTSYLWIYSYIFIYFEHWRKELGTHEETIFQPLSYVGQEHPLFITAYRPMPTREGNPTSRWLILTVTPTLSLH